MVEHRFTQALTQNADETLNIGPKDLDLILKTNDITPEALNEMVTNIRDWLKKQPHLPEEKISDRQIIGHLLFRCFSVEKVKKNIDIYFSARHRMPDILCNRDPLEPNLARYLKRGYWIVMPKKTPEDLRVSIFRHLPNKDTQVSIIVKIGLMLAEYRFWNDVSQGDHWILDLEGLSLNEVTQMTPVMISNISYYCVACFGLRLKSVHILNLPPFAGSVLNLFKKIIKSKIADRIVVSSQENVQKLLSKECLPVEYGGDAGTFQEIADKWCKTFQSDPWRQFFVEQNSVFSDESKRLTPLPVDEIFGVDGSFRKLDLD